MHGPTDDQLDMVIAAFLERCADEVEVRARARSARPFTVTTGPAFGLLRWGLLLLIALTTALMLGIWFAPGARPASPLTFAPDTIAFARGGDLWIANGDGSGARLLQAATVDPATDVGRIGTVLPASAIVFSPDGEHIAVLRSGNDRPTIDIVAPDGSSVPAGTGSSVDWSPDGKSLAVLDWHDDERGPTLVIEDFAGHINAVLGLPSDYHEATVGPAFGPAWSPDGEWIAIAGCVSPCHTKSETHTFLVAANASGWHPLTEGDLQDWTMDWSPTDPTLAIGQWGGSQIITELAPDGTAVRSVAMPAGIGAEQLTWSPDGTHMAISAWPTTYQPPAQLMVVGPDGVPEVVPTGDTVGFPRPVRWSSDGSRILYTKASMDDSPDTLWTVDLQGGAPRLLLQSDSSGLTWDSWSGS
jgi:Tol biopolymer transport system component